MVYVFLADRFEITEAMAPIDMLKRAKIDVTTVGIGSKKIKSSCGVTVETDICDSDFEYKDLEGIVLPGGPGTKNLENSKVVQGAIRYAVMHQSVIAAICAAPYILGKLGLLTGKNAICFPGYEDYLRTSTLSFKNVVTDGRYITAKGAGVSVDFGLEIVKKIKGEKEAERIRNLIQCQ